VEDVEDIGLKIGGQPSGTANSPHERQVLKDSHFLDRPEKYIQHGPIPATRTKDQGEARLANIFISQRMHEISARMIHRRERRGRRGNLPKKPREGKLFRDF
jgi:hypothetical protein